MVLFKTRRVGLSLTCALCRCFQSVLIHLQTLWELMLLGEPLVIMAPSPTVCSETVLALIRCCSLLLAANRRAAFLLLPR